MTFTITFTDQEMQVLHQALAELPFRMAAPLINSINRQIVASQQANGAVKETLDAAVRDDQ